MGFSPSSRARSSRDDDRGTTVVELRRVARRDGPAGLERGLQLGERFEGRLAGRLIFVDEGDRAFSARDLHGHDLVVERSLALGAHRPFVRAEREAILVLAPEAALLRDKLASDAHAPGTVGLPDAVAEIRLR